MKNRTSLFVLAVEILGIVVLHTLRASANDPSNISAKEVPAAKAEMAIHGSEHRSKANELNKASSENTSNFQ